MSTYEILDSVLLRDDEETGVYIEENSRGLVFRDVNTWKGLASYSGDGGGVYTATMWFAEHVLGDPHPSVYVYRDRSQ